MLHVLSAVASEVTHLLSVQIDDVESAAGRCAFCYEIGI